MYCHHCGKETKNGHVVCDECKEKGIANEKQLDNTYIEQLEPDELDFKAKGPVHPIKGKGLASMILGIIALVGLVFQIFLPGGLVTVLICAILSFVFNTQSNHTKGKKYGNVGMITSLLALVLIQVEVVLLIMVTIFAILIIGLSSIIAILSLILSILIILIKTIIPF